jgi:hypothetical protein
MVPSRLLSAKPFNTPLAVAREVTLMAGQANFFSNRAS